MLRMVLAKIVADAQNSAPKDRSEIRTTKSNTLTVGKTCATCGTNITSNAH